MTIAVPVGLDAEQQTTVSISGSSRTDQTITVTVTDGGENSQTIDIQIDGDGNGSATWEVPNWDQAVFKDYHCDAVSRAINPAPG